MSGTVLVCGGRSFGDRLCVYRVLDALAPRPARIVHGNATGADSYAAQWAADRGVGAVAYNADWKTHGKAAGPIRNQRMLDEGHPTLVIAFPGGNGTADMAKRARKAGIPVTEVPLAMEPR